MGFPDSLDGLPTSAVDKCIEGTRRLHVRADSTHKPSMLLDVEKGQPLEVEVIFGEVVRMAKARNMEIPVNIMSFVRLNQLSTLFPASALRCSMHCCWSYRTRYCGRWGNEVQSFRLTLAVWQCRASSNVSVMIIYSGADFKIYPLFKSLSVGEVKPLESPDFVCLLSPASSPSLN